MRCFSPLRLFVLLLSISIYSPTALPSAFTQSNQKQITVRGKVSCLDENGHRLDAEQDCNKDHSRYEILTSDGQNFNFSSDDLMVAMFAESRVRRMELQIKGLLYNEHRLELTKIQSIHSNKVYDIFYYCEVCKITAYGAGPCPCCYQPLEFI